MDLVKGWAVDPMYVLTGNHTEQILSLPSNGNVGLFLSSLTFHKNSGSSTLIFSLDVFLVPVTEKHLNLMLGATG